jgi:ACT domain-containing protein
MCLFVCAYFIFIGLSIRYILIMCEHLRNTMTAKHDIQWRGKKKDTRIILMLLCSELYVANASFIYAGFLFTGKHIQVAAVRRSVEKGKSNSTFSAHQDMGTSRSNHYTAQDNDDFIASESDRQLLLMRQQDEELDELSESVQRIGGVGLTIHEELSGQERILNDLSLEMETTSNRLDFVQKRVAMVMKKAGIKGQIMLILFLVVLFIILFVLVFLT